MYLAFTRMPGETYRRRLRTLLLYLCYVFGALITSLVCWLCTSALGLVLFQISVSAVTNTEDTELLLLRRKQTLVRTDAVPRPSEDYKSFMKIWLHASRHITINTDGEEETRKSPMGRGHWVTDICYSLKELWNWNWQGCCHAMSNQFRVLDVTRVAVLQGLFCPTNKHKPTAISEDIDDSCMWKESRTSVLFGRSGSGAIRF